MGKRSRKRPLAAPSGSARAEPSGGGSGSSRRERDAARRRRAEALARGEQAPSARGKPARRRHAGARPDRRDRPPAPWGSFPLAEIVVLLALGLGVAGLITWGERGFDMVLGALALGSLVGLELALREHLAGFRSHTTLLAGTVAVAATAVGVTLATRVFGLGTPRLSLLVVVLLGVPAFAGAFVLLRRAFRHRSGGLSFR